MPFGIQSAQEVFQKTIDMAFESINGCNSIIDDMLVWGSSKEDHDQILRNVPERTRDQAECGKMRIWRNRSEVISIMC